MGFRKTLMNWTFSFLLSIKPFVCTSLLYEKKKESPTDSLTIPQGLQSIQSHFMLTIPYFSILTETKKGWGSTL